MSYPSNRTVRVLPLLTLSLTALALATLTLAAAQPVMRLAPFKSVVLYGGGEAILRHGPSQRVTLLKGDLQYTGFTIGADGVLMIDVCKSECPKGYRHQVEIEVVTPQIAEVSVTGGGKLQSLGSFPHQTQLEAAVTEGGMIDIRSMAVDSVTALVDGGGGIFTKPQSALSARVVNGGGITYWGEALVKSSVEERGSVTKGAAADLDKPLSQLGPQPPPPVPPLPTLPKHAPIHSHHQ